MNVLLTGSKGQLGRCLQDRFPKEWQIAAFDFDLFDITNEDQVNQYVDQYKPEIIINAAAYTAVDKAETDKALCYDVNVKGAQYLAQAAKKANAFFVHVSTDYVFNGEAKTPYIETANTAPQSVYGQTKLEGEQAVLEHYQENSIIIRTAWVFSEYGNNFVKTMLKLGLSKESLGIVSDQIGCPTYAGDLAQAIITFIQTQINPENHRKNHKANIYHFCGNQAVSWFEFANTIFNQAQQYELYKGNPILNPISTQDYPTPAKRPQYSVLNCDALIKLGINPSDWQFALTHIMKNIMTEIIH